MFLLARVVGITFYIVVLILGCILLLKVKVSQRWAALAVIFCLMAVMAYLNNPNVTSDLYRIRDYVGIFSRQTWEEFFESITQGYSALASSPIAMIYYKLLGYLPDWHLISLSSFVIAYSIIFYMINDFCKRMNIGSVTLAIVFFVWMSMDFFIPVTSTIRSYLASIFVVFCIYRETVQNRFNGWNILLYILASGMHDVGILLIAFRLGCFLIYKDMPILNRTWNSARVFLTVLIVIASSVLVPVLMAKFSKADSYMGGDVYSYEWEYRICLIRLAALSASWFIIARLKNRADSWLNRIWIILTFSLLLFAICSVDFTFFMRFCFFTELLWIFPLLLAIDRMRRHKNYTLSNLWLAAGSVSLILTLARGYLCSLKFW